jgi:ankyrin repeat protein
MVYVLLTLSSILSPSSLVPPCNNPGGHLDVVKLLVDHGSDLDSQDNRKVSCLMAAFRKVQFSHNCILISLVSGLFLLFCCSFFHLLFLLLHSPCFS